MRGNHNAPVRQRNYVGSIPACAGQPNAGRLARSRDRVYPRVCGATPDGQASTPTTQGLSPRVRGNRSGGYRWPGLRGSIPACAGQPDRWPLPDFQYSVYPRVCGATYPSLLNIDRSTGLSPRVRGNHVVVVPSQRSCRVYPRVCGATPYVSRAVVIEEGLSPRVRGNLSELNALNVRKRSIPACAGQPGQIAGDHRHHPVYPRVCGATDGFWRIGIRGPGSIPACAGQPDSHPATILPLAVYPRVCGATSRMQSQAHGGYGLSPRVRGNLPGRPE